MVTKLIVDGELIAELPDAPGNYVTPAGLIEMNFVSLRDGSAGITLRAPHVRLLQSNTKGRHGTRKVTITPEGRGQTMVGNDSTLTVVTEADLSMYRNRKER